MPFWALTCELVFYLVVTKSSHAFIGQCLRPAVSAEKGIHCRAKHFEDIKEFKDIVAAKGTAPGKWNGSGYLSNQSSSNCANSLNGKQQFKLFAV